MTYPRCPATFAPFPDAPEHTVRCIAFAGHVMYGHDYRESGEEGFEFAMSWYDSAPGAVIDRNGKKIKR